MECFRLLLTQRAGEQRGRAIGTVMTGLLLGILLARTFAGWVSHLAGWRSVFAIGAVMNAVFVPLLWKVMPKLPPKQNLSYGSAMRSLWTLYRTQPLLRESSAVGGLVSCFRSAASGPRWYFCWRAVTTWVREWRGPSD